MNTWLLTDLASDTHVDHLHVMAGDVGSERPLAIRKRTLRGGLRDGVEVVEIDNGRLKFTVVPTRGMGLWRAQLGELVAAWQSPVRGPVNPAWVPIWEPTGIGWLSGFDELLVRCGLESNGAPQFGPEGRLQYPLHGRIANLPAHHVEVQYDPAAQTIAVVGTVDEARLFGSKLQLRTTYLTHLGMPRVHVIDEITNLSAEPTTFELLYHVNFGAPLATPGSRIVAPVARLAPRDNHSAEDVEHWDSLGPATAALAEYAHYAELAADETGRTCAMLVAADGARAASLQFNVNELPCFTIWKNQLLPADGYVTGLEPGVNFPNRRSFEERMQRVPSLGPGDTRRFEMVLELHDTPAAVAAVVADISSLQALTVRRIDSAPRLEWSRG